MFWTIRLLQEGDADGRHLSFLFLFLRSVCRSLLGRQQRTISDQCTTNDARLHNGLLRDLRPRAPATVIVKTPPDHCYLQYLCRFTFFILMICGQIITRTLCTMSTITGICWFLFIGFSIKREANRAVWRCRRRCLSVINGAERRQRESGTPASASP